MPNDKLATVRPADELPHDSDSKTIKGMASDAGVATTEPQEKPELPDGVQRDGPAVDDDNR